MNHLPTPSNNTAQLAQTDPFYQAAVTELEKGYVRLNLMADAMTHALGDELAARPLYLQQVALKLKQEQKIKLLLQTEAQPKPATQPPVQQIKHVTRKRTEYGYLLPVALVLSMTMLVTFVLMKHLQAPLKPSVQQKTADVSQPLIAEPATVTATNLQPTHPADDRQVLSYLPRDGKVRIPTEQPTAAASACQHNPVMSNQDYLNCGLKPPNSTSNDAVKAFDPML